MTDEAAGAEKEPVQVLRSCSRCGTLVQCAEDALPEGWSVAIEDKRRIFQCAACVRANITWIEGGISSEWWDR